MSNHKNGKLLDDVRQVMRVNHYSIHTERIYIDWIRLYVKFHKMNDRVELLNNLESKVEEFLSYLAIQRKVAVSTQNQAMNALVFLFKRVLETPLEKTVNAIRSTKNRKIPVVLTQYEVKEIITLLESTPQLVVKLLYSSGLRITEAVRLHVQDIDFDYKQITVRSGMGNKDRVTTFSTTLMSQVKDQLQRVKFIHDKNLLDGYIYLPNALSKNTLMLRRNGFSNMFFLPETSQLTLVQIYLGVIMLIHLLLPKRLKLLLSEYHSVLTLYLVCRVLKKILNG